MAGKRPKAKSSRGDLSSEAGDEVVGRTRTGAKVRHSDSEFSSTEAERAKTAKRQKSVESILDREDGERVSVSNPVEVEMASDAAGEPAAVSRASRPRTRPSRRSDGAGDEYIGRMKEITGDLCDVVLKDGADMAIAKAVIDRAGRYETLMMGLIAENERLRGRLEAYDTYGVGDRRSGVSSVVKSSARPSVFPVKTPPVPKPVETWAVVVKGKESSTSKEVMDKVVEQVAPSLGVRVHEVRPVSGGGAVIRTPSVAERQRIADNTKFSEVGLVVSVSDKLGPRISVQRVHAEITTDEFMEDLYQMNFGESMSQSEFRKSVRLVSPPWSADGSQKNVVLECTPKVAAQLEVTGVYIKWFRFSVRTHDAVQVCYRCCGFDHRAGECRVRDAVCRRCGFSGHIAQHCGNDLRCRNCELKGWAADHSMMSLQCPVYAGRVARVNARH